MNEYNKTFQREINTYEESVKESDPILEMYYIAKGKKCTNNYYDIVTQGGR